jgi:rare lipoprotein A
MKNFKILLLLFVFIISSLASAQVIGNATYYSKKLKGHHTSDGGKYHPDSLTCAHLTYPFGTILKVKNPKNDKEVIVKVTDRGPHQRRLLIDLSYSAAKQIDIITAGIAKVEIIKLDSMPECRKILEPITTPLSKIILSNHLTLNQEFKIQESYLSDLIH